MMNKAINTLVLATVDSLTKFKNKLAYYLAIFAMVFGSTFGTMNSANAAAVTQADTAITAYANDNDVVTFNNAAATTTMSGNDEFATGLTTAGTDTVWGITGGNSLTISGALAATATSANIINLRTVGTSLIVGEAWTVGNSNSSWTINMAASTDVEVTGADTHVWAINGTAQNQGDLIVTNTSTFSGVIGGTNKDLNSISVATGKTGTFSETVRANTITSVGTSVFKK